MKNLTCFKAYDIRGRLGDELNEDIAYAVGRAFAQVIKPKSIALGADIRLTSESLKAALARGLRDEGSDVLDLGLTGTEEIYFAVKYLELDGGIEVTASHNPQNYNGMKFVGRDSVPIGPDNGLYEIKALAEQFLETMPPKNAIAGSQETNSVLESYINHLFEYIDPEKITPLKIVVNAGNGAAGHVVNAIEQKFQELNIPVKFIKINNQPDGTFPKGIPNPLLHECRAETSKAVLEHEADLGIAWDGDFDRCFLFDEKGRFIEGYYIVGLLAEAFLQHEPGAKIIHDPRLTWNSIDIIENNGGQAIQSKTGHAFIKDLMRKEDAVYGGEMSAHHYFRDFAYCDSGMIPWLLVIELMSVKNQALSELVNERISLFPSPGEINFKIEHKEAAIQRVRDAYEAQAGKIETLDGVSMEFHDWRFNLRCSNTEPLVRLNLESRGDTKLMEAKLAEITALLNETTDNIHKEIPDS